MYGKEEISPVIKLAQLIEKVVESRALPKPLHRHAIEEVLFGLIEGKDLLNPYERRQVVDDEQWKSSIKDALAFLNLRKNYDKIYKN